ncbi:MAG: hypothetical protein AAF388_22435 [Bacteroidota bacterium]
MKNYILFLLAGFSLTFSQAQTVMDASLTELDSKYLVAEMEWEKIPKKERANDEKIAAQLMCYFDEGEFPVKDDGGAPIKFKSEVSVLNFMEDNGFELVSSYFGRRDGLIFDFKRYIFKRKG